MRAKRMGLSTRFWHRASVALVAVAGGAAAMATFVREEKAPEAKLALPDSRPPVVSVAPATSNPAAVSMQAPQNSAVSPPDASSSPGPAALPKGASPSVEIADKKAVISAAQAVSVPPPPAPSSSPAPPPLPPVQSLDGEAPASRASPSAPPSNRANGSAERSAIATDRSAAQPAPPASTEPPARRSKQARRHPDKKARSRPAPFPIREFFALRP